MLITPFGLERDTLRERWQRYRRIIPADAPSMQIVETRRAYYGGAQAVIDLLLQMDDHGATAAQRIAAVEAMRKEIEHFRAEVDAERA